MNYKTQYMKQLQLLLLAFFLVSPAVLSQDTVRQFGDVSLQELEMTEYKPDTSAEAVVLYDVGVSKFEEQDDYAFDIVFTRKTRVKILSKAGLEYAEVSIPFYREDQIEEEVYDIEGYTYNLDGEKRRKKQLDPSKSYTEKESQNWYRLKFAMPDVRVGSVIEYKYKISTQYKFNLRDWRFQWQIPVKYSEYTTRLIPFFDYTWVMQGAEEFDFFTKYRDKENPRYFGSDGHFSDNAFYDVVQTFGMKEVPAFKSEKFITSVNDYIKKIDFQLKAVNYMDGKTEKVVSTWPKLIEQYLDNNNFGRFLKRCERKASRVMDFDPLEELPEKERFNRVMQFVKTHFKWNGHNSTSAGKKARNLIKEYTGNSADINLLATGFLREAGLEAYPVLISTRDHGKIKVDYPYKHFFNYVLIYTKIDGKPVLTDATEPFLGHNRIPPRCINDRGLVVNEKEDVKWMDLKYTIPSHVQTNFITKITTGSMTTQIKKTATEYDAFNMRKEIGDEKKKLKEKAEGDNYQIIDSTIRILNHDKAQKPYQYSYKVSQDPKRINDKIYVSPFLDKIRDENPLKQKKRTYPVDIKYPRKKSNTAYITIPKGYTVDYLPENLNYSNELFDLQYFTTENKQQVIVTMAYYFKKPVYKTSQYKAIKNYFSEIVERGNEKIVLKKQDESQSDK